jgi:cation diffusion facilitator CzcD-associated flavoprotein CzcO
MALEEITERNVNFTVDREVKRATVVVIGAGQAGLSAAYHLARQGYVSAEDEPLGQRTFVVLDGEKYSGGAWQHRWESLRMATVNGIFDLPGYPKPPIDERESSREAVPNYFAAYEKKFQLPIKRPVHVGAVRPVDDDPDGYLLVESDHGQWLTRVVINATGTWTNPVLPKYPGADTFRGQQLHTHQYVSADEFSGLRVAVVGGGISAVQQLEEISRFATTHWYTRRDPVFITEDFLPETLGQAVVEKVAADVQAGRPSGSVVSYTGLPWNSYTLAAKERGVLVRRPMFTRIEPHGVREADGTFTSVDVILWATGFKAALAHLDPLQVRNDLGGITMRGTEVAEEPRIHLVGFGPSQSTIGANRDGRSAVRETVARLDRLPRLIDGGLTGRSPARIRVSS